MVNHKPSTPPSHAILGVNIGVPYTNTIDNHCVVKTEHQCEDSEHHGTEDNKLLMLLHMHTRAVGLVLSRSIELSEAM